jgi:hypothetical protein
LDRDAELEQDRMCGGFSKERARCGWDLGRIRHAAERMLECVILRGGAVDEAPRLWN